MKSNHTNGTEFGLDEEIAEENGVLIGHTTCDYCQKEILGVWDSFNSRKWVPYLGVQARKPNVYKYSTIIQKMREHDGFLGKVWSDNPLLNSHARYHSQPNKWHHRASNNSIRLLCNSCFQLTYNRILVREEDGTLASLSVLDSRGETIESVMEEFKIKGEILGKGAVQNY